MAQNNQPCYTATERRYTPQELADLWQCCIETVYDLLRQGRLAGFKLGRDWRITESAIRAYEQDPANRTVKTNALRKTQAAKPMPAQYRVV